MRTRPELMPGGWRYKFCGEWQPTQNWGEDDFVQWGTGGLVFTDSGSYRTAFFEAFPADPKTFIRGEGENLYDAEAKAFIEYLKYKACDHPDWERRGYRNGLGFCTICGMSKSGAFSDETPPPTPEEKERLDEMRREMDAWNNLTDDQRKQELEEFFANFRKGDTQEGTDDHN